MNTKMKLILIIGFCLIVVASAILIILNNPEDKNYITSFEFTEEEISLPKDYSSSFSDNYINVANKDDLPKIIFSVDNSDVLYFDKLSGNLKIYKSGTATLTAFGVYKNKVKFLKKIIINILDDTTNQQNPEQEQQEQQEQEISTIYKIELQQLENNTLTINSNSAILSFELFMNDSKKDVSQILTLSNLTFSVDLDLNIIFDYGAIYFVKKNTTIIGETICTITYNNTSVNFTIIVE